MLTDGFPKAWKAEACYRTDRSFTEQAALSEIYPRTSWINKSRTGRCRIKATHQTTPQAVAASTTWGSRPERPSPGCELCEEIMKIKTKRVEDNNSYGVQAFPLPPLALFLILSPH